MKTKQYIWLGVILAVITLGIVGCAGTKKLIGANPVGPSSIEQKIFDITTNHVVVTNYVTSTVTNNGVVTSETKPVVTDTESYSYAANQISKSVASGVSFAINTFAPSAGTATGFGLLTLLSIWGHLRGTKNRASTENLAQAVETLREFIKSLPNGTNYDAAITSWLKSHQIEADLASHILEVVNSSVDNQEAKAAAESIKAVIDSANKS